MQENWLEAIANELVSIRQELEDLNKNQMPWELKIAAQLRAADIRPEHDRGPAEWYLQEARELLNAYKPSVK